MNVQDLRADYIADKAFKSFHSTNFLSGISHSSPTLVNLILLTVSTVAIILVVRRILLIKSSLKQESVLLEITPPAFTEKTAYTTAKLFSVIHRLGRDKTFLERLLGTKTRFSFEIVSSRSQGIRYVMRIAPKEANSIKRDLLSYLPGVQVKTVNEYLPENTEKKDLLHAKVIEFAQARPFPHPLQRQDMLEEHDPVAYITGQMTKLASGELISFQIVLSPTQTSQTRIIKQKIFRGEDVLTYVNTLNKAHYTKVLGILVKGVRGVFGIFGWALSTVVNDAVDPYQAKNQRQAQFQMQTLAMSQLKPARMITSFEQQAIQSIERKIDQPLFETRIRLLMIMKDKNDLQERVKGFSSSLDVFSATEHQSLRRKRNHINNMFSKYLFLNFQKRLLSFVFNSSPDLLSASEISDIYHFPFTNVTQTENIVKVHSKQLPAPLSLKQERSLDVVFAKNNYAGATTMIGLSEEEREKHMYIIGSTGSGKTTMISSMVKQDIENGKGVAVIDPHGDLAESILSFIPEKRKNDLIYVNPDDLKFPIGINLLELSPGLDEDDVLREKEFITESIISLFRKVFSESMAGHAHRIEYILRNTIQTALTLEHPTLFTIYDLLNNPPFQESVTRKLTDENLKNFWKYEYGKAGDYQKVKMISPVAARIGRFLFSPSAKRMLEQEKSTINFDEILDKRKILICNLAKGKLGEDTSEVLGIMIISKLQLASLRRAKIAASKRTPFYLYVDEFQNFATTSFIQMLSEARKYKTYLVMAEQSTSQQKDRNLVNVILANVGTVVSFRSANPEDEKVMLPQFSPYVEKGEIANLPRYNFYIKISAVNPEESFSGQTIPIEITYNKERIEKLIDLSRAKNAIVYQKPEPKQIAKVVKEVTQSSKITEGKTVSKKFIPEESDIQISLGTRTS